MLSTIKFSDIPSILRRENLIDAINFCQELSVRRIDLKKSSDIDEKESMDKLSPWFMAVFMNFAIAYCSYPVPKDNCQETFSKVISIIARQALDFQSSLESNERVYMPNYIGFIQRGQIENRLFDIYRHKFYFNYNDLIVKTFLSKFKISYERIFEFACFYYYCIEIKRIDVLFNKIHHFKDVFDVFTIKAKEIKDKIIDCLKIESVENMIYYRFDDDLYSKPVLEINSRPYCPLYFLLYYAIGNILMYQFTRDDDDLHGKIGKEARENYLIKIVSENIKFDSIFTEKVLKECHRNIGASDLAITLGNEVLFIESKSTSPNLDVINLDDGAIDEHIDLIARHVRQIYNHMYRDCVVNKYYHSAFKMDYEKDNVYGIIVLREFTFAKIEKIYDAASELIGINDDDEMKKWMINHILLLDINNFERLVFRRIDLISFIKKIKVESMNDIKGLNERCFPTLEEDIVSDDYLAFYNDLKNKTRNLIFGK